VSDRGTIALFSGDDEMRKIILRSKKHSTATPSGSECPECSEANKEVLCRVEKHYGIVICHNEERRVHNAFSDKQKLFRKLVCGDLQDDAHALMQGAKDRAVVNALIGRRAAKRVERIFKERARSGAVDEEYESSEPEEDHASSDTASMENFVPVPRSENDQQHEDSQHKVVGKDDDPGEFKDSAFFNLHVISKDRLRAEKSASTIPTSTNLGRTAGSSPPSTKLITPKDGLM